MNGFLESLAILGLAAAGTAVGLVLSRRKRLWIFGAVFSMALIVAIAPVTRIHVLQFVAPFSWLVAGRTEYALYALAVPLAFATLAPRLPHRRQRRVVTFGAAFCTLYLSLPPFLIPPLARGYFESLETILDKNGICIQSNGYTCGPAAAVTALRHLGFDAEEGELAILASTTPIRGTAPDSLCDAIRKRWGPHGLACELRYFSSIEELKAAGVTITVIKLSLLLDHYVTVLNITDDEVIVGDPLQGRRSLTHEELQKLWRHTGIVVRRERP